LPSQEELDGFVRDPRESVDTELKGWIDPASKEGIIKIAKAVIALFNNNGGRLIVGIKNDGKVDTQNVPADVRKSFHPDVIQAIATKYASQAFEVTVEFGERGNQEYPIISVPGGVETPVAAKSDLNATDGANIKSDTVYVRTLNSNNTVSSAPVRAKDLDKLVKTCFDNREADIGAFFRRHIGQFENLGFFGGSPRLRDPTPVEQAIKFLDVGWQQFQSALPAPLAKELGTRESAFVIAGDVPSYVLNEKLLWQLESQKPNHTGWTPWILSGTRPDDTSNPYIFDAGYQRLMLDLTGKLGFTFGDFWRIEVGGKFYHVRINEDDTPGSMGQQKPAPGTLLDFLLQISRTAEVISIGLAFARALGCDEKSTSLAFAFRWRGLKDRYLASWVEPGRSLRSRDLSRQDSITTDVLVPLETPRTAIAPYAEKLVAPLFALFAGLPLESSVIEGIVNKALGQRY
jgi:hypothetical protein